MESYRGVSIVYEDNHLLVVVKPPNMPTQADDSGDADLHSTMKAYIAEKYQKPGAVYLGLVHRLDRPVGGLVVLAKTSKAADRLSAQVRDKTMHRQYVAAVRGTAIESAELCDFLLKDWCACACLRAEATRFACSFPTRGCRSGAMRVMAAASPANRLPSGAHIWG